MIILISAIVGACIGVLNARRRKGTMLDQAQYGAAFAIAFAILGLFATLGLEHFLS